MSLSDYSALTEELFRHAAACGQPLSGTFELTDRCNLRCRMCYVCADAADRAVRATELTATQWLELSRQAVDAGMLFLLLTGGEIFLRPDFFDIYEPLAQMGLHTTLFTNATLVTPEVGARLAQNPPSRLEVTVYGATRSTYEAITGVPGSYDRCLAGIDALLAAGLLVTMKTTLSRDNVGEYAAIRQLARDRGLPFMASWLLGRRRDGEPSEAGEMRLSAQECVELEANDELLSERWPEVAHMPAMESDSPVYCMAGKANFFVDPTGAMGACIDLELPGARPLEAGFLPAWQEVQEFVRSVPYCPQCQACALRKYCPTCPARARLETGSLTGVDDYCCQIAQARFDRFAQRVAK